MSTELIINASLPETRIALMESGEIQDLLIERATGKGIVGNIYKGRVTRVLPGMQAAFVDIGLEKAAFLYVDDVFVHSEVFEEEEGQEPQSQQQKVLAQVNSAGNEDAENTQDTQQAGHAAQSETGAGENLGEVSEREAQLSEAEIQAEAEQHLNDAEEGEDFDEAGNPRSDSEEEGSDEEADEESEDDFSDADSEDSDDEESDEDDDLSSDSDDDEDEESEDEEDDDHGPVGMSAEGEDGEGGNDSSSSNGHPGTIAPQGDSGDASDSGAASEGSEGSEGAEAEGKDGQARRGRHRRGRRGGKFRRREKGAPGSESQQPQPRDAQAQGSVEGSEASDGNAGYPENYVEHVSDEGSAESDRSAFAGSGSSAEIQGEGRPEIIQDGNTVRRVQPADTKGFKSQRDRERRIPSRSSSRRPARAQVNIQDLLKEGQEVLVQVAKDPISTKGARLTCHISLPGRHLVCMPTIDHVGVSRRIDRDEERRRLRDVVERNRPRNLGFIVRTASGRGQAEKRIKQDIDYLTRLWDEIREKSANTTAPALVYEDLNSVLRAIRDWVTDDIDKIIVDSRYHYNEIQRFVAHFMPSLRQKVELYHGDIPIFDAYNISTELSRALERKVWLKSGGYIVVDQAEALVAIDVNTGRYVGKKNLEDTILKTNLEAVQEIAYQLRLRNCGGIIILDLIDMEKEENKQRVYRALEEALKRDRARPTILKISELGLVEMTRKRTRDTIVRALCESCSHCEGKGFIKSKATVAYEVLREIEREGIEKDVTKILVQAHPEVIDILAIDERETLDQIERRYRKQIYLQAVTDSHVEQFEVAGDKKPGKTAGEFSEVVQTYRTHTSNDKTSDRDRGRNRDRGGRNNNNRSGGRDQNRQGVVRNDSQKRDQGRDANRDGSREGRESRENRDNNEAQPTGIITPLATPKPLKIQINRGAPVMNAADPSSEGSGQVQTQSQTDENFGNRAQPEPGNSISPIQPVGNVSGNGTGNHAGGADDFYDEEDRLAFLRAQAAQDAALARLRSSGEASPSQPRGGRNNDRGGRNNNNNNSNNNNQRRGRRGGKFGGGRDTRTGQGGQGGNGGGGQNRGPRQFTPRGPGNGPTPITPNSSGGNGGNVSPATSDSSSDRGDNDGGPGDHSQPPA